MPIYEYQCDECGLRDEKLWSSISKSKDTIPCESCGKEMRKLISRTNFAFAHTPSGGPRPQNTGVHSIDYNFDKVIGEDAAQKWKKIEERNAVKDSVIRDERKAGKLVTRDHLVPKVDGSGEYRVITEAERVKANAGRTTAFEVAKAARKSKEPE